MCMYVVSSKYCSVDCIASLFGCLCWRTYNIRVVFETSADCSNRRLASNKMRGKVFRWRGTLLGTCYYISNLKAISAPSYSTVNLGSINKNGRRLTERSPEAQLSSTGRSDSHVSHGQPLGLPWSLIHCFPGTESMGSVGVAVP